MANRSRGHVLNNFSTAQRRGKKNSGQIEQLCVVRYRLKVKRPGIALWLIKALVLSLSSGAFGDVVFLSETSQGCALVCLVKQARRFLKRLKEREREREDKGYRRGKRSRNDNVASG